MGSNLPIYGGIPGHNRCADHPSEPLIGMCGCGALFCRRCSPSTVFCARCYQEHVRADRHAPRADVAQTGWPTFDHPAHAHERPLSQKVMLEALFLTILATLALAAMFGFQERSFSLDTGRSAINYGINPGTEPVQNKTSEDATTVSVPGGSAILTSDSSFTINAKVEGAMAYDDAISDLVPYDLLLTWGALADGEIDSRLVWEQGDRRGQVSGSLGGASGVELSADYVIKHVSNNHLIPSTDRIEKAIGNIKPGDLVRIDGRLVDVRMSLYDGRVLTVNTSKTRSDQGEGACEIIYVEHLRVNGQTY